MERAHIKCMSKVAIINSFEHIVGKEYQSFLYSSLIEPHVAYCVEVWGNADKSNLHPLYVKQNGWSHHR